MTNGELPPNRSLPIEKLAAIFQSTTNSYKHLFFHALLTILKGRGQKIRPLKISYPELAQEMLVSAFHTVRYYRLKLGKSDVVKDLLDSFVNLPDATASTTIENIRGVIANNPEAISKAESQNKGILRYVPYKILSPWIRGEVSLSSGASRAGILYELTHSFRFDTDKFLYRTPKPGLRFGQKSIELHPEWQDYLLENIAIVEGWANHHWLFYLQSRNPNVPFLGNKLWIPQDRIPLTRQRGIWREILSRDPDFPCIYTDQGFGDETFALDHFLPRSWVGHDQLWNLIPTSSQKNSEKGQKLPSEVHIDEMCKLQGRAMRVLSECYEREKWEKKVEDYITGLNVTSGDLLDPHRLESAYRDVLAPQLKLAEISGFPFW